MEAASSHTERVRASRAEQTRLAVRIWSTPLTTPATRERDFFTTTDGRRVPALSVGEMREVDRVAVEQTGPALLQMMEHAGAELAQTALEMLGDDWRSSKVIVLAGGGNNGGGGVCAARHLANRGVTVLVVSIRRPAEADGALGQQLLALAEAPAQLLMWDAAFDTSEADLVIDAVIGTGLKEAPRARQMALIRASQAASWACAVAGCAVGGRRGYGR